MVADNPLGSGHVMMARLKALINSTKVYNKLLKGPRN